MRLKLYRAACITDAMSQVRRELGPDALILATRRVADGVELTAALDPVFPEALPPATPAARDATRAAALVYHGVPPAMAELLHDASLEQALAGSLPFGALPLGVGEKPLLLAGPPGAGKTLTVARLATRLVLAGLTPMVITADGRRAGATEQLAAFTRLLGLNLLVASHPVTLGRALLRREGGVPVLIDAPGCDPFDPAQRDELAALAAAADATIALILPAGMDAAECADLAAGFAQAGACLLVATRLDMARRLGGVLTAARAGQLSLTEAGTGPGASDSMVKLTPAFLAARLLQAASPASRPGPSGELRP